MFVTNGYVLIPAVIILLWALLSWIYLRIYNRNIDHVLHHNGGKKLISPSYVSVFLLIVLLIANNIGYYVKTEEYSEEYNQAKGKEYLVWSDTGKSLEDLGNRNNYTKVYSIDENPGFYKDEYIQNDFKCTLFTSEAWHDGMHPDAILYTEHTADIECKCIWETVSFETESGEKLTQYSTSQNNDRYTRLLFTAGAPCKAVITYGFLDEAGLEKLKKVMDEPDPSYDDLFLKKEVFTVDLTGIFGG